jgi:NADPH-dependent ferric siderophore reductase
MGRSTNTEKRPEIHASYKYKRDFTLRDRDMRSTHLNIDIVLGEYLVTAVKDEGAANSFISKGLAEKMGY